MVVRSTDGGQRFNKPTVIASFSPFDQPSTDVLTAPPSGTSFRTNSYPSISVDNQGRVYCAWSKRGLGPGRAARIVLTTSLGGLCWSCPDPVYSPPSRLGHQFMPSLTFACGKLMIVWYDQCNSVAANTNGFGDWINDDANFSPYRQTIDVYVSQANPGPAPAFKTPVQVSRYLWALKEENGATRAYQVQYDPPNYPLFKGGTTPFQGDYIDIAPSPPFVLDSNGIWRFNTAGTNTPIFHVAWTDNRDVRPPVDNNWTNYNPPNSNQGAYGSGSCSDAGRVGMRNQNIYTSRLSCKMEAASPRNVKPLGTVGYFPSNLGGGLIPRAFVIYVRNTSDGIKSFRLKIVNQPVYGKASFLEFNKLTQLDVKIAPYSIVARTVFVTSTKPDESVKVNVLEIDAPGGNPVSGGLTSTVVLNQDPTTPAIPPGDNLTDREIYNPNLVNPDIVNWTGLNPNLVNPNLVNPNLVNPDLVDPNLVNPNLVNPNLVNPNLVNPNLVNPNLVNPNLVNPNLVNPNLVNTAISDVTWTATNEGNTNSPYTLKLYSKEQLPIGIYAQLLIYRVYYTPAGDEDLTTSDPCKLKEDRHHELLLNSLNPNLVNPNLVNPNLVNPNLVNAAIENATFSLAPGDEALITLRVIDPDKSVPKILTTGLAFNMQTFLESLGAAVTAHAVNTEEAKLGETTPPAVATKLVIGSAALPDGFVNQVYHATLNAYGGTQPYTWALNSGEFPTGLTISSAGVIAGTPTTAGTYHFIVEVRDSSGEVDTQRYSIIVYSGTSGSLTITTSSLFSGVKGYWYGATLEAIGGAWPRTWSLASGSLPPGLNLDSSGVISGTPTGTGIFTFGIRVTDMNGASVTKPGLSISIAAATSANVIISGMVRDGHGNPLNGVVMRGLPGTPTTGESGNAGYYEDKVPQGWSGTAIPFKVGSVFTPASRSYNNVSSNQTGQDYNYASGAAAKLAFRQQPSDTAVGAIITPAVTVEIQDASGNLVASATNTVLLSLLNAGEATLGGTPSKAAVAGVATFNDLSIDKIGTGYQLRANSGSLTEVDSNAFNITAGMATTILVETAPDGSGTVVPAQNLLTGSSINGLCNQPVMLAGNFVENVSTLTPGLLSIKLAEWSMETWLLLEDNKSAVFSGNLLGTAQIRAAKTGLTSVDSGVLTVTPVPLSLTVSVGSDNSFDVIVDGVMIDTIPDYGTRTYSLNQLVGSHSVILRAKTDKDTLSLRE